MIFARKRRCPSCGDETMRYPAPPGLRMVSRLISAFAHWRRCRRCHRVVLTLLPDQGAQHTPGAQRRIALGRRCPACDRPTERAQTPAVFQLRKRLLLGLGSYRRCWSCGWSGLAVQAPGVPRPSRG